MFAYCGNNPMVAVDLNGHRMVINEPSRVEEVTTETTDYEFDCLFCETFGNSYEYYRSNQFGDKRPTNVCIRKYEIERSEARALLDRFATFLLGYTIFEDASAFWGIGGGFGFEELTSPDPAYTTKTIYVVDEWEYDGDYSGYRSVYVLNDNGQLSVFEKRNSYTYYGSFNFVIDGHTYVNSRYTPACYPYPNDDYWIFLP